MAGGFAEDGRPTNSAELYHPDTGVWSRTGLLSVARRSHSATLLADGRVLVAGGIDAGATVTPRVELYDPATGEWMGGGSLRTARFIHTATRLDDGRVLIIGGSGQSSATASAELYDPVEEGWTTVGSLATARRSHSTTVLPDGRVLVAGGVDANSRATPSAEVTTIFNWFTPSWPWVEGSNWSCWRPTRARSLGSELPSWTLAVAGRSSLGAERRQPDRPHRRPSVSRRHPLLPL